MTGRTFITRAGLALALAATLAAPASGRAETVWAVGDGGVPTPHDDAVAARIESAGPFDRLLYLGDVYETGTADEFQRNYHPSFGRFKERTSPIPGNHEWENRATGYDPYWGARAPTTGGGHWYSFGLGAWHVVALNTEEDLSAGSRQLAWLRRDLANHTGTCTVAMFHKPRYSASLERGDNRGLEALWRELAGRAVIALSGHEHNYQRFAPERGVVQLIAGTGGRHRYELTADPRLAFGTDDHFGALRLELTAGTASFAFVTSEGATLDSGAIECSPHSTAPAPFVTISRPRSGRAYSRRLRSFTGTSRAIEGPVRITLLRRSRGRCRWFDGVRFRGASCATRRSVAAPGSIRWRYSLRSGRRLPRGVYRLVVSGRSADGRAASRAMSFRIL